MKLLQSYGSYVVTTDHRHTHVRQYAHLLQVQVPSLKSVKDSTQFTVSHFPHSSFCCFFLLFFILSSEAPQRCLWPVSAHTDLFLPPHTWLRGLRNLRLSFQRPVLFGAQGGACVPLSSHQKERREVTLSKVPVPSGSPVYCSYL